MDTIDTVWTELCSNVWMIHGRWSERWCIFPRKCQISGRLLWMCKAYRGRLLLLGPGGAEEETRWHGANEHLVWLMTC